MRSARVPRPLRSARLACLQGVATSVLGVIGKPISHSRSPVLHNAALAFLEQDTVYVPLLVDDLSEFLASDLFKRTDYAGFSVTIPHKETALRLCDEVRATRRSGWRRKWRTTHASPPLTCACRRWIH
jgi:hypothetical protein